MSELNIKEQPFDLNEKSCFTDKHTFCSCSCEIIVWEHSLPKIVLIFEVEAGTSSVDLCLVFVWSMMLPGSGGGW